jgi:hypothetical protein
MLRRLLLRFISGHGSNNNNPRFPPKNGVPDSTQKDKFDKNRDRPFKPFNPSQRQGNNSEFKPSFKPRENTYPKTEPKPFIRFPKPPPGQNTSQNRFNISKSTGSHPLNDSKHPRPFQHHFNRNGTGQSTGHHAPPRIHNNMKPNIVKKHHKKPDRQDEAENDFLEDDDSNGKSALSLKWKEKKNRDREKKLKAMNSKETKRKEDIDGNGHKKANRAPVIREVNIPEGITVSNLSKLIMRPLRIT